MKQQTQKQQKERDSYSFKLFQQVKVDVNGNVTGHESLLRVVRDCGNHVLPEGFIKSAEDDGRIVGIGNWVIREAIRLSQARPDMGRIAVNVSPKQIDIIGVNGLEKVIKDGLSYCPDAKIDVEITESCLLSSSKMEYLGGMLKNIGVGFHIDDFGTGYSNLSSVCKSGADAVKIDGELIRNLNDPRYRSVVEGFVRSMSGIGITIIAEGVEEEWQKKIAAEIGCHSFQGFLIGKPFDAVVSAHT